MLLSQTIENTLDRLELFFFYVKFLPEKWIVRPGVSIMASYHDPDNILTSIICVQEIFKQGKKGGCNPNN